MTRPRVMGLDLSAEQTGVALPDGATLVIKPRKVTGRTRTLTDDLERLYHVADTVRDLLGKHGPQLAVIEDYAANAKGQSLHRLAEIGGVVRLACYRAGVPIALVNIKHVKMYATGNGSATKSQMAVAALERAGCKFASDDECDAWWMRAMGMDWAGNPIVTVPKSQRDVLGRVKDWPEGVTR